MLAVTELPDPVPRPGQLSIDVSHAAVGLIDVFLRQACTRTSPGAAALPGLEVVGTVRALGDGVCVSGSPLPRSHATLALEAPLA